jgi:hypothetical protein
MNLTERVRTLSHLLSRISEARWQEWGESERVLLGIGVMLDNSPGEVLVWPLPHVTRNTERSKIFTVVPLTLDRARSPDA